MLIPLYPPHHTDYIALCVISEQATNMPGSALMESSALSSLFNGSDSSAIKATALATGVLVIKHFVCVMGQVREESGYTGLFLYSP